MFGCTALMSASQLRRLRLNRPRAGEEEEEALLGLRRAAKLSVGKVAAPSATPPASSSLFEQKCGVRGGTKGVTRHLIGTGEEIGDGTVTARHCCCSLRSRTTRP
uniref:Uncharacterized protein n=1 Tax=Arundo donax TaxID=35708 RepID=A0A0A9FPJ5_ARUDO